MLKAIKNGLYGLTAIFFIILLFRIIGYDRTAIPDNLVGKSIEINDLKIRYSQTGEGQDLLFIHGTPGSMEDWDAVIKKLPLGYRATRFDRPGYGFSESSNSRSVLSFNAEVATKIIHRLNLNDVIIIGHSYGAGVALETLLKHPEVVRGCVLMEPLGYPLTDLPSEYRIFTVPVVGRGLASIVNIVAGRLIEQKIVKEAFYPNTRQISPEHIEHRSKIWSQAKVLTTVAKEISSHYIEFEQLSSSYNKMVKPIYLIHGVEDRIIPVDQTMRLEKALPYSKSLILENIGHQSQFARPDLVINAIERLY